MKYFILILSFICTVVSMAQVKVSGVVVDENNEPISFATVIFENSTVGTTTDEKGAFYLESDTTFKAINVSFLGFASKTIPITHKSYNLKVVLEEDNVKMKEVIVYSGKVKKKGNPAIKLLKKIWKHKRQNGLYKHKYYEYDKYEKIEFDLNNIDEKFKKQRAFKGMEFIFEEIDTSAISGKAYLPIFINEALYKTYGKNHPRQERDELLANQNSGFSENQNIIEFVKQLYVNYNVYDNYIKLFHKSFTSPLSRTGTLVYNYILSDSSYIDNKWCYKIVFYPRRKSELTFKGDFWVNDTTFAVKKIQMSTVKSANINWVKDIYIEQDFEVIDDSLLLLKRDYIMSDFALSKKETSQGIYGRRTTLYNDFIFDKPKADKFYRPLVNKYNKEALNRSEGYWETHRMEKLNKDEKGVYKMLDTLKTVKKFRQTTDLVTILSSGYWQIVDGFRFGPIYSVISVNDIEGTRLRLGGKTFFKRSDQFRTEGYLAYGFKDQKLKHAFGFKWLVYPDIRLKLIGGHKTDVEQLGFLTTSNNAVGRVFASADYFSRGDNSKLTAIDLTNLSVEIEPLKNLKLRYGGTYKTLKAADLDKFDVSFHTDKGVQRSIEQIDVDLSLTYTPGKKPSGFGVERTALNKRRVPTIYLGYTKGIKGKSLNSFDYYKLQLYCEQRLQLGGLGRMRYILEAGKTFNSVPLSLMDIVPGNQMPVMARQSFDLLDYYEFVTDQYAGLHIEHNFNGRIFSRIPLFRKLQLREIVGARAIVGSVSQKNVDLNASKFVYRAPTTPYWEYHVGVGNIFKLLRIDFIFRGNYRDVNPEKKSAIKLGINFHF